MLYWTQIAASASVGGIYPSHLKSLFGFFCVQDIDITTKLVVLFFFLLSEQS